MSDVEGAMSAMPIPAKLSLPPPPNNVAEPPKRRGRPPGSPNKKTLEARAAVDSQGSSNFNIPRGPRSTSGPSSANQNPNESVDQAANRDAEKKQRAQDYATLIHEKLNEELFTFIIGMRILPAEAIYKTGHIPPNSQPDPNLTEMGNMLAIPTDLSKNAGRLMAELSYTNGGKSVQNVMGNNNVGILLAAGALLFSGYRYTQQLKPFLDMVKGMQEAQVEQEEEE